MSKTLSDFIPGLASETFGLPVSGHLSSGASAIAAVTSAIDTWLVPSEWKPGRQIPTVAVRLTSVQISIGSLGTGGTAGSFAVVVKKLSNAVVVASATIAYNATTLYQVVSLLNPSGHGLALASGDGLVLGVTAVPTGITGGGTGITARFRGVVFSVGG